jgi:hypothetical protein
MRIKKASAMRLSDIAGSKTISEEDWKKVTKAFEQQKWQMKKKEENY